MKMMKKMRVLCFMLGVFCLGTVYAVPVGPLNGDPTAIMSGISISPLHVEDGRQLLFDVAYAVYDSHNYRGADLSYFGDQFIYAYQIENSRFSTIDLKEFSVPVPPGGARNISYDISGGIPGGIYPTPPPPFSGQPLWKFEHYPLLPGTYSSVLLFSSSLNPGGGEGTATVNVGGDDGIREFSIAVPVPTPEPVTLALLGIGAAMMFRKRSC